MSGQSTNSKLFFFLVIIIIIQRTFSAFAEIQYPEIKYINKKDSYGLNLMKVRSTINIISVLSTIYILYTYDIHIFLQYIFVLLIINHVRYFLFDLGYIDLFMNHENQNHEFVTYMDKNGNKIGSMILSNVTLFLLIILLA